MESVEQRVKRILDELQTVDVDQIKNEDSFVGDLEMNLVDTEELLLVLEEEFQVRIPDEEAEKLTTVQDVINYLREESVNDQ